MSVIEERNAGILGRNSTSLPRVGHESLITAGSREPDRVSE